MCEQTEINYLDGDIVWVKLGACWWPGQVTSFHNLPEDIQVEFQKKPLIAAVKFFQEDTYEFVKNLHQIYKYNCTQKDDFIKKGLDKLRTKSKDGTSYMDKFPGDVEMAEKLTGGDPDILTSEKFSREEKPDISSLFGEKKIPKRKRDRDEMNRRSEGSVMRKITHPRFIKESDHEIRIRQQPSSMPNTPKASSTDSPQFSCHLCNFTSTRVNVIICHRKSHCTDGGFESPIVRPRILAQVQSRSSGRPSVSDTQKRKYVRKTKSLSSKDKNEREIEPVKRKLVKQIEKATTKKKKTDPELREKLLADWDDESDEDMMDLDINKSSDNIDNTTMKNSSRAINSSVSTEDKDDIVDDGNEIIKASEKLLRETEKITSLLAIGDDSLSRASRQSNNKNLDDFDSETDTSTSTLVKDDKSSFYKKTKKLMTSGDERKSTSSEKDDKQSRFSCFDFDEDDLPEPTITPVRKIPRVFGEKNTSVKKEILKKFTMSQALKNESDNDHVGDDKNTKPKDFFEIKEPKAKEKDTEQSPSPEKVTSDDNIKFDETKEIDEKNIVDSMTTNVTGEKSPRANVTELEIVEIFEVEGEKDETSDELMKKSSNYEIQLNPVDLIDVKSVVHDEPVNIERLQTSKVTNVEAKRRRGRKSRNEKEKDDFSEIVSTETEDDTVSELAESLQGNSENSDTDGNINRATWAPASTKSSHENRESTEKAPPRRRGRPRKHFPVVDTSGNVNDGAKHELISKQVADLVTRDSERKTSESDSERSYSGRRRKPNKRYFHTDIYTSSPENRGSRTDESQSETEEKSLQEEKIPKRRGKKKSIVAVPENRVESTDKSKDEEFEFSNRTLNPTDAVPMEGKNVSKIDEELRQELHEVKSDIVENVGETSASCVFDFVKKLDSGSTVHITKLLSSGDNETGSLKTPHDQDEKEKSCEPINRQDIATTILENMEIPEEAKSSVKFNALRTNVDKLPPKKSQIKKFELSQIDLLDACAEQVAAEQAAAEKIAEEKAAAADKLAAEKKIAEEKLAAARREAEKLAAEKIAEEIMAAEKLAAEKLAMEKLAAEKLADEKQAAEILAAEKKIAGEKIAAEKLAAEKLIAEKLAAEKLAGEKMAAEKLAAERLIDEKLAAEKIAAEKKAAEKLATEKLAAEKKVAKKLAAEKKAADEKLASEKEVIERAAAAAAAAEKLAAEEQIAEETKASDSMVMKGVEPIDVSSEHEKVENVPIASEKNDPVTLMPDNVVEPPIKDSTMETIEAVLARITSEEGIEENTINNEAKNVEGSKTNDNSNKIDAPLIKETVQLSENIEASQQFPAQNKQKSRSEIIGKTKKDSSDEEIPVNSFQEAFLKTLHIDKKEDEKNEDNGSSQKTKEVALSSVEVAKTEETLVIAIASENNETFVPIENIQDNQNVQPLNAMTEFEGVEILVQENIVDVGTKISESNESTSQTDLAATLVGTDVKHEETLSLDLQKIQDTLSDALSTPSPNSDVNVPVKKREKPRIIENVTLKEPMQILKSKLMEKPATKTTKHKLESEAQKKGETKGAPRAKIMKIESPSGSIKGKSSGKSNFTITRKLQVLKAEEAATAAAIEKEKAQIAQTMSLTSGGEKFIQQSSQSLADMELDINSMPFVLSEDVLTPESIENMPVVISSIIPSPSASITTPLSLTPTTQLITGNPETMQFKSTSETGSIETTSSGKKKSGTPAILKNKGKGKPTITSIKTLVPPFAGGVKGLKFQSQQTAGGKVMPVVQQKSTTPGKYVIVQTAGGQQMRYSVQGKPGSAQKIAIPAGKATGSAQIVQQGGKVVILTSAQSGQTKMLPLNISKNMSGKVQKIVNNKGQIYTPISSQSIIGSKTIIAPKSDGSSPTTSKLAQGQKIINTQGIITSKGLLTPITSGKTSLLGTLSQGILTKGGLYTPISSAQLAGKTLITGKNLGSKGTTILSPMCTQSIATSKGTLISPMSHTLTSKTILNAQGLVTPKGTVLTPITGQQVKAIAAKSPAKGGKLHYQAVQQKLQLPMLQKCPKIPVSTSGQIRAGTSVKSPGVSGTIVLQNTGSPSPKSTSGGKKIVRQASYLASSINSPQTPITQTIVSPQQQSRGKSLTPTVQRVVAPRTGRQTKGQQKIVVQKMQDNPVASSGASPITNVHGKSLISTNIVKTTMKQRTVKSNKNAQKHLTSSISPTTTTLAATSDITTAMTASTPLASTSTTVQSTLPVVPSLVISGTELPITEAVEKSLADNVAKEVKQEIKNIEAAACEATKVEATKVSAQPQIMALPTESSDGTQTYVLVTIDEQGQIQPLDNNTLMSLEGTTQNPDGTRTLYIDPSSLGEAGTLDNIVLQFDNGVMPNIQSSVAETSQSIVTTENFPTTEIIQTSNQDILAAALANTDFQQEIGLPESVPSSSSTSSTSSSSSVMTGGLTQTSLINQTILQSTIIPPTEPISSPSVLETSLTLNQPIMTPLEVPSNLPIQAETAPPSVISTIPTSLELPITITNPNISYISSGTTVDTTSEGQIQIPGNSMPDIGDIMESTTSGDIATTEVPPSTRYLVLPTIDDDMTIQNRENETDSGQGTVTYSVTIPENIVIDNTQGQTTPSMPIIDDGYVDTSEARFTDESNEISKVSSIDTGIVGNVIIDTIATNESIELSIESQKSNDDNPSAFTEIDTYASQDTTVSEEMIVEHQESIVNEEITKERMNEERQGDMNAGIMDIDEQCTEVITKCASINDDTAGVKSDVVTEIPKSMKIESTNIIDETMNIMHDDKETILDSHACTSVTSHDTAGSSFQHEQVNTTDLTSSRENINDRGSSGNVNLECESMIVEEAVEMIYPSDNSSTPEADNTVGVSSQCERNETASSDETMDKRALPCHTETSQEEEAPSQSYEQFETSGVASDSTEIPTQSAAKSENSREPSQSVAYESMEIDENIVTGEPPTQSYDDAKSNEASQSYETTIDDINRNAPTQSFNEIMQCQEVENISAQPDAIDDQSFPTQSYEVDKLDDDISVNMVSGAVQIGHEGNIPSQSNDIGNDGIGTSSVTGNNSGLNEDETASSSYVPETPETQERDQDQESAISTSSYEIPPCEELNIASSSVIPDTSVRAEHMSIHDNGVPEIPTSSYNLNPDSSSTSRVDGLPTSSYEDRVIVEQNVSTSYEVAISMPGIAENSAQNFVTESTNDRNEPTSYYARHPEVTASYYDTVNQDSNSRLVADPQEEVTPSYYEQPQDITSEASQSYFRDAPRYTSENVSPSYYDPAPETEASQSSYYSHEIEGNEQSSRNVEASQSFYQETSDEMRLRQQGEATPTYTERYPVDYALANSPIERHDLVESSVPATRPAER